MSTDKMEKVIETIEELREGQIVEIKTGGFYREIEPIHTNDLKSLANGYKAAIAERDEMRQALEHYADQMNWEIRNPDSDEWQDLYSPVKCHGYDIAQAALNPQQGER